LVLVRHCVRRCVSAEYHQRSPRQVGAIRV
jgi:hypothetical protein